MDKHTLIKKRNKYTKIKKDLTIILKEYYQFTDLSDLYAIVYFNSNIHQFYNNGRKNTFYFINKIRNHYDTDYILYPEKYKHDEMLKNKKCLIHIVHVMENYIKAYKKKIKDIDKLLYI